MTLAIITPVFGGVESGSVSLAYHEALTAIRRAPGVEVLGAISFLSADLVRCRSRGLHMAYERGFDHVLFWDADVIAPPAQIAACLRGMLASGHEIVGAPYPRKREPIEPVAHGIVHEVKRGECHPCTYIGMGFTLIARTLVEKLYDAMIGLETLFRYEVSPGVVQRAPCPFLLTVTDDETLLSEDASFCHRALMLTSTHPWLYVGEGSALRHVGSKVFGS